MDATMEELRNCSQFDTQSQKYLLSGPLQNKFAKSWILNIQIALLIVFFSLTVGTAVCPEAQI